MIPADIPTDPAAGPPPAPGGGERLVVVILSLAGGLGLLALALALLAPLAPPAPTAADLARIRQEIVIDDGFFHPEPLERFLYIAGVLLLPFCLGAAYLAIRRLPSPPQGRQILESNSSPAAWVMAPLVIALLFLAGSADDRTHLRMLYPGGAISLAASVALAVGLLVITGNRFRERSERILRFLLPGLIGLLFLGIIGFNAIDQEHIRNIPVFRATFNAFFFSVVQVFFGKELLVDFVNQYGLYPHFLEPLFRVIGLSVLNFTVVMGLLNCVAFGCMYRFLVQETDDKLLAFLALATLLFSGFYGPRLEEFDLYMQNHPLRIIFPGIALLVVRKFAHGPTPRVGVLLSALGAAAFLWNPDSGAIVLASGFLLIVYDALLRRRPREIPLRLLQGAAAAAAVVASFSLFLKVHYGAFPDYTRLFLHSKAFYGYGAMMFPMPRFGLWVPVLLAYAAALLLSLVALVKGEETPRARILFYLSVFGLGIFSYYQGRSVLGNLIMVSYPAVLLVILYTGELRRNMALWSQPACRLQFVTILALLCYSVPALVSIAPIWSRGINEKIRATRKREENDVLKDARFLRYYLRPGQQAVILSFNSGIHHLVTQTTSPLDIPGESELVYQADYLQQEDYIQNRRGIFVLDKSTVTKLYLDAICRANPGFYDNPFGFLYVFPMRPRPASWEPGVQR